MKESSSKNKIKFFFSQQGRESSCHLNSWLNLKLLHALRKSKKTALVDIEPTAWKDNDQWIGLTYKAIVAWQKVLAKLTNSTNDFNDYQQTLVTDGIHLESIYTKSQKLYCKEAINPLQNLQRFLFIPFNFINSEEHPDALLKSLPVFSDGDYAYIYNVDSAKYEKLIESKVKIEGKTIFLPVVKKHYELTPEQWDYLQLPVDAKLHCDRLKSYESKYKYGYSFMFLPEQAKEHVYYHVGLYQLILFSLGVDRDNNDIHSSHELYPAYQTFLNEIKSNKENPWVLSEFKKENFFEYHLAELFKKNKGLKQKAIDAIKCMPNAWEHYESFGELYDSEDLNKRNNLNDKKKNLPGDEQILAYSFSMCLRLLWASAISQKALRAVMEVPRSLIALTRLPGFPKAKEIIFAAYQQKEGQTNFIQAWHEVYEQLLADCGDIKDFASFNGHGSVISFAEDVIKEQISMKCDNSLVIKDLKLGVIDSLYANTIKPFYHNAHNAL